MFQYHRRPKYAPLWQLCYLIFCFSVLLLPFHKISADVLSEFKNAGAAGGYNIVDVHSGTVAKAAGLVVFGALSLLGVIFIVLVIYAGYLWMTAHGKSEQIEKARTILFNALVGILIVFSAMVITNFILSLFIVVPGT